jgi:hypothetical protein
MKDKGKGNKCFKDREKFYQKLCLKNHNSKLWADVSLHYNPELWQIPEKNKAEEGTEEVVN